MTPENYDPNTNESGDSYQSSHPYGVPEGQRPGPYQHYQQQPPVPVSYTHLTLPTNSLV